jgi:hypothetical protein
MSIKLMARVWERSFTHAQQAIMLALADHADDDGSHVYPSLRRIAWKTGYSLRQVKRIIGELRRSGALILVAPPRRGRGTEYQIRLEAASGKTAYTTTTQGDKTSPQRPPDAVTSATVGVTFPAGSGDISGHIEPSSEPSGETKPSPARSAATNQPAQARSTSDKVSRPGQGTKSSTADTRHGFIRTLIEQLHLEKFGIQCQWDGSEAAALTQLLVANASWSLEQITQMVRNRFDSEGISPSRPRSWLRRLDDYATGPLDRYGKTTIGGANATSRAERDEQQTHDAIAKAGRNLIACNTACGTDGVGQGDVPEAATDRNPS